MAGEADGVRRLIEELSAEALKEFLRNLRHHSEVQARILRGELTQEAVNSAYVGYARHHAAGYRREVTELTADYYRNLRELSTRYSDGFYDELLTGRPNGSVPTDEPDAAERVAIELHGLAGREIVARFVLENADPEPAGVSLEPGWCRGPDGQPFTAPLSIQPASLVVPPGGSVSITLRLALLESLFIPGLIYRMPVRVLGPRPMQLDVAIWAEEDIPVSGLPDAEPEGPPYRLQCPRCGRTFERSTDDLRLRPHKNPEGEPCPERDGHHPVLD
jgi:hypothetical protein